jgi:hypothetical protein
MIFSKGESVERIEVAQGWEMGEKKFLANEPHYNTGFIAQGSTK